MVVFVPSKPARCPICFVEFGKGVPGRRSLRRHFQETHLKFDEWNERTNRIGCLVAAVVVGYLTLLAVAQGFYRSYDLTALGFGWVVVTALSVLGFIGYWYLGVRRFKGL